MIPDYRLCDVCSAKCTNSLFISTERKLDAAGSPDDFGENWDLCQTHMRHLIFRLMKQDEYPSFHDYDKGIVACEYLKEIRSRNKK